MWDALFQTLEPEISSTFIIPLQHVEFICLYASWNLLAFVIFHPLL